LPSSLFTLEDWHFEKNSLVNLPEFFLWHLLPCVLFWHFLELELTLGIFYYAREIGQVPSLPDF